MKRYKKGSSCGFSGPSRSRVMENQQQAGRTGKHARAFLHKLPSSAKGRCITVSQNG